MGAAARGRAGSSIPCARGSAHARHGSGLPRSSARCLEVPSAGRPARVIMHLPGRGSLLSAWSGRNCGKRGAAKTPARGVLVLCCLWWGVLSLLLWLLRLRSPATVQVARGGFRGGRLEFDGREEPGAASPGQRALPPDLPWELRKGATNAADHTNSTGDGCPRNCPPVTGRRGDLEFCNSLDWDAPLLQKACDALPEACRDSASASEDGKAIRDFLSSINVTFRLLVHYVYYESSEMEPCEVQNKRLNLEYFITQAVLGNSNSSVEFHFSSSGTFPEAADYFDSIGLQQTRQAVFPRLPNVRHRQVVAAKTDLCAHGNWMAEQAALYKDPGDFVMLLNDGVRGPFVEVKNAGGKQAHLRGTTVPHWFVPFLAKFARNPNVAMTSTMISTELGRSHLQSYALSIPGRVMTAITQLMATTCDFHMDKKEAVWNVEVGMSTYLLGMGYSLGSLWPSVSNFTISHDVCASSLAVLQPAHGKCRPTDIEYLHLATGACDDRVLLGYHLLNRGRNPSTAFKGPVTQTVFAKHGGEVYRRGLLNPALVAEVQRRTDEALAPSPERPRCKV